MNTVTSLVTSRKGHVISDQTQMARIHLDTVSTEYIADFSNQTTTCRFNTIDLSDLVNVIALDLINANIIIKVPNRPNVDTVGNN